MHRIWRQLNWKGMLGLAVGALVLKKQSKCWCHGGIYRMENPDELSALSKRFKSLNVYEKIGIPHLDEEVIRMLGQLIAENDCNISQSYQVVVLEQREPGEAEPSQAIVIFNKDGFNLIDLDKYFTQKSASQINEYQVLFDSITKKVNGFVEISMCNIAHHLDLLTARTEEPHLLVLAGGHQTHHI